MAMNARRIFIAAALSISVLSACGADPGDKVPEITLVAVVNASADSRHAWANTYCGAALVEAGLAITATHCVGAGPLPDLIVGERDLCSDTSQSQRVGVARAFNGIGDAEGITLLQLSTAMEKEPPPIAHLESETGPLFTSGWGRTAVGARRPCSAKRVDLVLVNPHECEGAVDAAHSARLQLGQFSCLRPSSALNTCIGDSGSGVYSTSADDLYLYGITLGGVGCGTSDAGVYGNADAMRTLMQQWASRR